MPSSGMAARETDSEVYAEMVIEHNVPKGMIERQPTNVLLNIYN